MKRTCQINAIPPEEDISGPFRVHFEACGKPATWSSDDVTPDSTVWMCDECQRRIALDLYGNDARFDEVSR